MASNHTAGYHPATLSDWNELLQSLAARDESPSADRPQKQSPGIDTKSRAALVGNYVADLEYCLKKANNAIRFYEDLVQNYDRLVAVMEESRNQAYDIIDRLKHEITVAKRYKPFMDAETGEEGGQHE